jgi:hypothetical protein
VVNDAATMPASLRGRTIGGEALEARLTGPPEDGLWRAVLFGAGSWRERTEDRPAPPPVGAGESLFFEADGVGPGPDARRTTAGAENDPDAALTARIVVRFTRCRRGS